MQVSLRVLALIIRLLTIQRHITSALERPSKAFEAREGTVLKGIRKWR